MDTTGDAELNITGTASDAKEPDDEYNELCQKRIYQVEPPPKDIEGWEKRLDRDKRIYGTHFKNDEEATLFCMLPLTHDQRVELLQALREERKKQQSNEQCAVPAACA